MRLALPLVLCAASAQARPAATVPPRSATILPRSALRADGERVHRLKLVAPFAVSEVRAARGAIVEPPRPAEEGAFTVGYRPPRVEAPGLDTLTLSGPGGSATAQVRLEPAGRAQLSIEAPPQIVLGNAAAVEVVVRVRDAAGQPARAPLRLAASIGRLGPARETATGEYRAAFSPPPDRFPQVAILAALSVADGAFAAVPVRLHARVPVEGEGEPGASMSVVVEGRTFGPELVGERGRFSVPVVVPPGGRALGVSIDRLGNRRERPIDLGLPPFPRLLLVAVPPELRADGRAQARLFAFAVDARGAPEHRAPLLRADVGALSKPQGAAGATTWLYTAPRSTAGGAATLRAGSAVLRLPLKPGPVRALELEGPPETLTSGAEAATVVVRARDADGSPVPGARLEATLRGGRVLGVEDLGDGRYRVRVQPPADPGAGAAVLHVEVAAPPPGPPRRLALHLQRGAVEAWVDDDLGWPVEGAQVTLAAGGATRSGRTDRYGVARFALDPTVDRATAELDALPGLAAALDRVGDARAAGARPIVALSRVGEGLDPEIAQPAPAALDAALPLALGSPVDLDIRAGPFDAKRGAARVMVRCARSSCRLLYRASAGRVEEVAHSGLTTELRFFPPAPGRYLVTVTDAESRVSAFAEVVRP